MRRSRQLHVRYTGSNFGDMTRYQNSQESSVDSASLTFRPVPLSHIPRGYTARSVFPSLWLLISRLPHLEIQSSTSEWPSRRLVAGWPQESQKRHAPAKGPPSPRPKVRGWVVPSNTGLEAVILLVLGEASVNFNVECVEGAQSSFFLQVMQPLQRVAALL